MIFQFFPAYFLPSLDPLNRFSYRVILGIEIKATMYDAIPTMLTKPIVNVHGLHGKGAPTLTHNFNSHRVHDFD